MDIKIFPKPLNGVLNAIPAKSHLHRVLLANALSENPGEIITSRFLKANDIEATTECLKKISNHTEGSELFLYCGESATTLRFLIPVVCAKGITAVFCGEPGLKKRPILPLLQTLGANGIIYETEGSLDENQIGNLPILANPQFICKVSNQLEGGDFLIPGNTSSQFISGLLFAAPLLKKDSVIAVSKPCKSYSYINVTTEVLEDYCISVDAGQDDEYVYFYVRGSQPYISPSEVKIQGDWSNGAFWLGANYLSNGNVKVNFLPDYTSQGDHKIVDYIEQLKKSTPNIVTKFSIADCPDLGPILAILAASTEGNFVIEDAEKANGKESDRLEALVHNLSLLGADIKATDTGLEIKGSGSLDGGELLDSYGDHRIVMALTIASIKCDRPIAIKNFQAVNKSYPSFFEDFKKIGGDYMLI